jgi:uncharacterized repeat protein (TIGR01451 family)
MRSTFCRSFLIVAVVAVLGIAGSAFAEQPASFGPGHFSVDYNGVNYDLVNGTTTLSYTLNWTGEPPALSHFGLAICPDATVLSASPEGYVGPAIDPALGNKNTDCQRKDFYGIKWDAGIQAPTVGNPVTYTVTLEGLWATGTVEYSAKAGEFCNLGTTTGATCRKMPAIRINKSCDDEGGVFVGGTLHYTVTVTNIGDVSLSNISVSDPGATQVSACAQTLAAGASSSCQYTKTAVDDPEQGGDGGTVSNTASVTATDDVTGDPLNALVDSQGNSCVTRWWRLRFPGSSQSTAFTRTWSWSIAKSGPAGDTTVAQEGDVPFQVTVNSTHNDHDYAVSGGFSMSNPSPLTATITSATVTFSSTGATVNATCSSTSIAPNSASLTSCTYSGNLGTNGDPGTATISVTLAEGGPFVITALYDFSNATITEENKCVTVTDTVSPVSGYTVPGPATWTYCGDTSATVNYNVHLVNTSAGCEQYREMTNTATLSGGSTASASATASIYTGACSSGCTLTIGYWKTHAGFTGRNPDKVSGLLPIWLGTPVGKAVQVTDAGQAVTLLSMSGDASNGINKLYAQLLAAKLNMLRGASGSAIATTVAASDAFLNLKNSGDWGGLSKTQKNQVTGWMSTLDSYNNGLIGPAHCN